VIACQIAIVPRYVETDSSGIVAPERYLPWFEMGRAALLREQGLDYRQFEAEGFWTPVLEVGLTFHEPAFYEDSLILITRLPSRPSFRIRVEYEVRRNGTLLASGFTVQGFVSRQGRPVRPPADFLTKLDHTFPRHVGETPVDQKSTAGP
jgi:acyl-CoA thioester hydrolase